jgi:hypothetical protein
VGRYSLTLTSDQRFVLTVWRDTHPSSAVRERASALLQIADGAPATVVARRGLSHPRDPRTLYGWVAGFRRDGLLGLLRRPLRRRQIALPAPAARRPVVHTHVR